MKNVLLCAAIIGLSLSCSGQTLEYELNDLEWISEFEKDQFSRLPDKTNYVGLLLCLDSLASVEDMSLISERVSETVTYLKSKKIHSKKLEKQVKLILSTVHQRYLEKYEYLAYFQQLIKSGTYNCVTASAFYALILEELGIQYDIIELPTHVFLIVDPSGERITLESTDPSDGVFTADEKFMEQMVLTLVETKQVSKQEFNSKSVKEIYDQFYSEGEVIDFDRLAAIHYQNFGIERSMEEDYEGAVSCFKKAYFIKPDALLKFNIQVVLAAFLQGKDFLLPENWSSLGEYARALETPTGSDLLLRNYKALTQEFLVNRDDTAMHSQMHSQFMQFQMDSVLKNEMHFIYHNFKADWCDYKGQKEDCLNHSLQAHAYQPNNLRIKKNITHAIGELCVHSTAKEVIDFLNSYKNQYAWLSENNDFATFYNIAQLYEAVNLYEKNKVSEADDLVEEIVSSGEYGKLPDTEIAMLYGEAWKAYVRLDKYDIAMEKVKAGLQLSPENYELKRFLKNLEEANR